MTFEFEGDYFHKQNLTILSQISDCKDKSQTYQYSTNPQLDINIGMDRRLEALDITHFDRFACSMLPLLKKTAKNCALSNFK